MYITYLISIYLDRHIVKYVAATNNYDNDDK